MASTGRSLGDAFEDCDVRWLTDAIIQFHTGWRIHPKAMGAARFDAVADKVAETLACMKLARETSSDEFEAGEEGLLDQHPMSLVPRWHYERSNHSIRPQMDYLWLDEEALLPLLREVAIAPARVPVDSADRLRRLAWGERLQALGVMYRTALGEVPWAVALRSRIRADQNFNPFEYHGFLAAVFWALTRHGFFGPHGVTSPPRNAPPVATAKASLEESLDAFVETRSLVPQLGPDVGVKGSDDTGGSIELFEVAYNDAMEARIADLNAWACWSALSALSADINAFETMEP